MKDDKNVHALYLRDTGGTIKQRALEARRDGAAKGGSYADGRLIAYYEVVSLLRNQAETFGISLEELQLDDIDPDRDLLNAPDQSPGH